MNQTTHEAVTLQFCLEGRDITGSSSRHQDTDCVRVWVAGGCILSIAVRRKQWVYEGSDIDDAYPSEKKNQKFESWQEAFKVFEIKAEGIEY